jgi:hypothetical protein
MIATTKSQPPFQSPNKKNGADFVSYTSFPILIVLKAERAVIGSITSASLLSLTERFSKKNNTNRMSVSETLSLPVNSIP